MKIRLSEIPQEGRSYTFSRKSGELNTALEDLVQAHPYDVEMHIKPIGNAYEMRGSVKTMVTGVCSLCGWDLEMPVDRKFHDILFEEPEDHRKSHSVHGNQSVDFLGEGPSMVPYKDEIFYPGEFVHELIALEEPFYPSCGKVDCEHLEDVRRKREEIDNAFEASEEKEAGHPAFSILKGLNLNSSSGKN